MTAASSDLSPEVDVVEQQFQKLKVALHQELVESLDLSRVGNTEDKHLRSQVRSLARELCDSKKVGTLGTIDRERLLDELLAEFFGLGPLENLFRDPSVDDILVNGPYQVFVERFGRIEPTDVIFADSRHLMRVIQRIVARLGRRIDEVSPMVDGRLPDGSRINAIIPPLALDGPSLSIRRFGTHPFSINDLINNGTLPPEIVRFLAASVESRLGVLISGGTGAGKTTLLNAVSEFIPEDERLVTIEDSAELLLRHKHRVRLETRPPNSEGTGQITQRDLVRNALRMRPDRILVGEVRGPEVWDMLQAMNTGHEGSLTTVHANSAVDALARLEMMVAMTNFDFPIAVVRQYIAAGISLIVHVSRLKGGARRLTQVTEIVGVQGGEYILNDVFRFEQQGIGEDGKAFGEFQVTGHQPTFLHRIRSAGVQLPDSLFEPGAIKGITPAAEAVSGRAGPLDTDFNTPS